MRNVDSRNREPTSRITLHLSPSELAGLLSLHEEALYRIGRTRFRGYLTHNLSRNPGRWWSARRLDARVYLSAHYDREKHEACCQKLSELGVWGGWKRLCMDPFGWREAAASRECFAYDAMDQGKDVIDGVEYTQWSGCYRAWTERYQKASRWARFWMDPFGWRRRAYARLEGYYRAHQALVRIKAGLGQETDETWDRHYSALYQEISQVLGKSTQSERWFRRVVGQIARALKRRRGKKGMWFARLRRREVHSGDLSQFQEELYNAGYDFIRAVLKAPPHVGIDESVENFEVHWQRARGIEHVHGRWLKLGPPVGSEQTVEAWGRSVNACYETWIKRFKEKQFSVYSRLRVRYCYLQQVALHWQHEFRHADRPQPLKVALHELRKMHLYLLFSIEGFPVETYDQQVLLHVTNGYRKLQRELCQAHIKHHRQLTGEKRDLKAILARYCPEQSSQTLRECLRQEICVYAKVSIEETVVSWDRLEDVIHKQALEAAGEFFNLGCSLVEQLGGVSSGTRDTMLEEASNALTEMVALERDFVALKQEWQETIDWLRDHFFVYAETVDVSVAMRRETLEQKKAEVEAHLPREGTDREAVLQSLRALISEGEATLTTLISKRKVGLWTKEQGFIDYVGRGSGFVSGSGFFGGAQAEGGSDGKLVSLGRARAVTEEAEREEIAPESQLVQLKEQLVRDQRELKHFFYAADAALKKRFSHLKEENIEHIRNHVTAPGLIQPPSNHEYYMARIEANDLEVAMRFFDRDEYGLEEARKACLAQYGKVWRSMAKCYHPDRHPTWDGAQMNEFAQDFNAKKAWVESRIERVKLGTLFYEEAHKEGIGMHLGWKDRVNFEDDWYELRQAQSNGAEKAQEEGRRAQEEAATAFKEGEQVEIKRAISNDGLAEAEEALSIKLVKLSLGNLEEAKEAVLRGKQAKQRAVRCYRRAARFGELSLGGVPNRPKITKEMTVLVLKDAAAMKAAIEVYYKRYALFFGDKSTSSSAPTMNSAAGGGLFAASTARDPRGGQKAGERTDHGVSHRHVRRNSC